MYKKREKVRFAEHIVDPNGIVIHALAGSLGIIIAIEKGSYIVRVQGDHTILRVAECQIKKFQ